MNYSRLLRCLTFIVLMAAVGLLSSCDNDTCGPKQRPGPSRNSPEALLDSFAESLDERKVDWYEECLAEGFVFELTDADVDSLGLPPSEPWLDRTIDVAAVSKMLEDQYVSSISFEFVTIEPPVETDGELLYRTHPEMVLEAGCPMEEPRAYQVRSSWLDFTVAEDPANDSLWVIERITEIYVPLGRAVSANAGGQTGLTATLGLIKYIYVTAPGTFRTAEQALMDYAVSIEARDIDTYGDCLDYGHRFMFVDAVADCLGTEWWDKETDLAAIENMFTHACVTDLQFDYAVVDRETTGVEGDMIVAIRILPQAILTYTAPGEEPIYYFVHDSYLDFEFLRRGMCREGWTMSLVEETPIWPEARTGPNKALTEPSTWSSVKAMFQ